MSTLSNYFKYAAWLLSSLLLIVASAESFGQSYGQRGVGYRDAFGALFGGHYPRGNHTFNHTQEALEYAPVFIVGPSSDAPFDSAKFVTIYGNVGTAGEDHYFERGFHSKKMTPTRLKQKFPQARGYVLTYQLDQVGDLPYTGFFNNIGLEVKHLILKPKAWGISPLPLRDPASEVISFADGDASVFGPAHPISRYRGPVIKPTNTISPSRGQFRSITSQLGRSAGIGIGFGVTADYVLTRSLPADISDPLSFFAGIYGGAGIDAYVLGVTSFSGAAASNIGFAVPILAAQSLMDIAQRSENARWEHGQAMLSTQSGEIPESHRVYANGDSEIIPPALQSTIYCHSQAAQDYARAQAESLQHSATIWRWMRRHGYCNESAKTRLHEARAAPSQSPELKPLVDFIKGF